MRDISSPHEALPGGWLPRRRWPLPWNAARCARACRAATPPVLAAGGTARMIVADGGAGIAAAGVGGVFERFAGGTQHAGSRGPGQGGGFGLPPPVPAGGAGGRVTEQGQEAALAQEPAR